MYKQNTSNSRRFDRSSSNKRRFNPRNRGRGGSGGNQFRTYLNSSVYVKKAELGGETVTLTPEHKFESLNLHPTLIKNLTSRNYLLPTKIQDQAIPHILSGKDLLGIGPTGTGKTGAFLIPMVDKVLKNPSNKVLIISPTRELASQIIVEFRKFSLN